MTDLSQRARQILYACITEFVASGEPVGSRTLSKKGIELSPASIRNVLSDLEELGYLHQPHTSAGRVPTDKAFRLFIDAMMDLRPLSDEENASILMRFSEIEPGPNFLRETGRLLSELAGTAAVVVSPKAESMTLKHLRFIRTMPGELLAVLVMANGSVQNRFLKASVEESELVKVHNLLDDVIEGRTLGELRDLFLRRKKAESVQHDAVRKVAFELGEAALAEAADAGADIVIEGRAKLLGLPEFSDAQGLKGVVNALDEAEGIVRLLDATLAAKSMVVVVGHEAGDLAGGQLSIIGAAYKNQGRTAGSVGIIGPTRMDYPKVVPLVTATANAMSSLSERRERDDESEKR
ncbi:Heat-inducible transcription repressor HrcA [Labilithrix luteola]|uniref:Heat-inducible transcription repressor HrcA n=1 Tax=Labilithrix luteola TaxID=1391654 RepID=A0A0K1QF12_9BACT|nr:heat-inducible transcriptional repressor HrcA [Labilithrix luteola]AKV04237.1 Heat-inducible transcription repressor HrcA [Labilithrix luteola]